MKLFLVTLLVQSIENLFGHIIIPFVIQDIRVLDAGCGTGNYAVELLSHGFRNVCLIDGSPGMLSTARTKISNMNLSNEMDFKVSMLPAVPYENATFDVVMINQVLTKYFIMLRANFLAIHIFYWTSGICSFEISFHKLHSLLNN